MRRRRFLVTGASVLALFCGVACLAQRALDADPALAALRDGSLVVWVVRHEDHLQRPTKQAATAYSRYNEQTVSTFGTAASNVGRNAGDSGRAPSALGASASASGHSASEVGQTAGSFGESLSTIGSAASVANGSNPQAQVDKARHAAEWDVYRDRDWAGIAAASAMEFPNLNVHYVGIGSESLQERLDAAAGTDDQPDLLVGMGFPSSWWQTNSNLAGTHGVVRLGEMGGAKLLAEEPPPSIRPFPQASILLAAKHAEAARAFVVWMTDRGCTPCGGLTDAGPGPAAVAAEALRQLLTGGGPSGEADAEMADFEALAAQHMALAAMLPADLNDLRVRVDVRSMQFNDRFAVVRLRAVTASRNGFGVLNALALLRVNDAGHWRMLHLAPNLGPAQMEQVSRLTDGYGMKVKEDKLVKVLGVAQATPVDGDNRSPEPDLWWDNNGGATMQVVEWQRRLPAGWMISGLYFVPDANSRLRTRVTARFANQQGGYRWRVWSVGVGGVVVISPWRALNILPR